MNKYAYTLYREILSELEDHMEITVETKIADIFSDSFDEFTWVTVLIRLELIYGFNIPDNWVEQTHMTIEEFGKKLSSLLLIAEAIYPEFYKLKIQMLYDVVREAKITSGLEEGTEEELAEIRERLGSIQERLNQITELPLN